MKNRILLDDISIRTELQPGDIGRVIHMHGDLYGREYSTGFNLRLMLRMVCVSSTKSTIPKEAAYGSVSTIIE